MLTANKPEAKLCQNLRKSGGEYAAEPKEYESRILNGWIYRVMELARRKE